MTLHARKLFAMVVAVSLADAPFTMLATAQSEKPRVAVAELELPVPLFSRRVEFRTAMSNAFRRSGRYPIVSRAEVESWFSGKKAEEAPDPSQEELTYARELLAKGKRHYESLKPEDAARSLEEARRLFIRNLHGLRSNRDLIDAHLYLGMSYAVLKEEEKAKEEFRRVVYLDPKRELESRDFSPKIIALFSEVKRRILEDEPVRVRVETVSPGGSVYLNGRNVGVTPLDLKLLPGDYFILVEKENLRPWYKLVPLKNRIETVHAELKPEVRSVGMMDLFRTREGAEQESEDIDELRDFAQSTGATYVFLGTVEKQYDYRLLGQLYDVRTSDFSQVAVVDLGPRLESFGDAAQSLVEALLEQVRPDGYLNVPGQPDLNLPPEGLTVGAADRPRKEIEGSPAPPKAWYERWWIYPLIAGAGVAIFFGARQISAGSGGGEVVFDNKGNF